MNKQLGPLPAPPTHLAHRLSTSKALQPTTHKLGKRQHRKKSARFCVRETCMHYCMQKYRTRHRDKRYITQNTCTDNTDQPTAVCTSGTKRAEHERRNINQEGTNGFRGATSDTKKSASKSGDISAEEPDLEPVHGHVDPVADADLSGRGVGQRPYHGGTVVGATINYGRSQLCAPCEG